jgi:hypothetical protein
MLKFDTGLINPIEREKTSHGVLLQFVVISFSSLYMIYFYDVICFVIGIVPSLAAILMIVFIVFCHKLWKYGSKRIREHLERDLENAI